MSSGKSIRLFLADGSPGGLLTAEIMNWTGHVIAAPRSDLAELLKRSEASRTGVYLLLGDDPKAIGGQSAYIGEGDNVSKRLYHHARSENQGGKDFWDRVIVLTSKDANLTKAHVRYLESRFIDLARTAGRVTLTNGTSPDPIALPEADVSDMEYYVEQARIVLPVLGVNLFRSAKTARALPVTSDPAPHPDSPVFTMAVKKDGIVAKARVVDGEFTVLEGSDARATWIADQAHGYSGLRAKLEEDGTIVPNPVGNGMRFTRDHVFSSPSAAAAVIAGRPANGRTKWRIDGSGTTYAAWESQGVEALMAHVVSSEGDATP